MQKIIVTLALMLASQLLSAQSAGETRISFVLTPQISWLKSDMDVVENKGSQLGYNVGLIVDRFFGDNYAFTTGITINASGGKLGYPPLVQGQSSIPAQQQTYKLRYLEIPVGLKLRSEDMHRFNIYGRFGLSPQINIMAKNKDDNKIADEVKLLDLGYHIGGGVEYSLGGRNALMVGILFNNGFFDTTDRNGFDDKAILNRLVFEFGFIF
ncbi:MAG TPA: PorT family protein [Marinilabiliaceae bacterium]|nr:PorT family protein [Marinilabiliaceae bacterium]